MVAFHTRDDLEEKALLRTLEAEHDVHAFDDMPPGILGAFVASWAVLLTLFWSVWAVGTDAKLAMVIVTLFVGIFFAVPAIMLRQAPRRIMPRGGPIKICTGELSVRAAAIQVLLIPSALILAIGCMSIIKLVVMAG